MSREARIPEAVGAMMRGASGAEWAVLFVLHLHAREGRAWPSLLTIGRAAGDLKPRTVTRALTSLERRGVITRCRRERTSTLYVLRRGRDEMVPAPRDETVPTPRDESVPKPGTRRSPEQFLNCKDNNKPMSEEDSTSAYSPEFEEFWEAFPQWRGSKFQAWQAWSERIGAVGAESLLVARPHLHRRARRQGPSVHETCRRVAGRTHGRGLAHASRGCLHVASGFGQPL
jgi:DNA-binding transcriptional ArsR family regulator